MYCKCWYCKLFTSPYKLSHEFKTPFVKLWFSIPKKLFSTPDYIYFGDWSKKVWRFKYWYLDLREGEAISWWWWKDVRKISEADKDFRGEN